MDQSRQRKDREPHPLVRAIALLYRGDAAAQEAFEDTVGYCQNLLTKTSQLYRPRYVLAAARVGQVFCGERWPEANAQTAMLGHALDEYRRALGDCRVKGVVQEAVRDLELIRAAGIEGLEPVFALLESALGARVSWFVRMTFFG